MALQPCRECGREVSTQAAACPNCGVPHPTPEQVEAILSRHQPKTGAQSGEKLVYPKRKILNPELMALFSFFVPGLGPALYGQLKKGAATFAGAIVLGALSLGLGFVVLGLASAGDAYRVAKVLDAGQPIGEWEWFPADTRGADPPHQG